MKYVVHSLIALFVGWALPAAAAVTCSVSSPGFYSVYDALATTDNLNTSTFTVNCTRLAGDPSTFNYIAFTDDGLYNTGQNNRAKLTTSATYLKYDFFTDGTYATNWSKSGKCMASTLNFGTSLSATQTRTFYSKVYAGQTGLTKGLYTDTVTVNLSYNHSSCQNNATADTLGIFQVQVADIAACQIATPPADLVFAYTSFQGTPSTATASTFTVRCSVSLPYTMALDANVDTVAGLRYSLALGATSGTGNGALQQYSVSGTMDARQAGSCTQATCTGSSVRSIIVTY